VIAAVVVVRVADVVQVVVAARAVRVVPVADAVVVPVAQAVRAADRVVRAADQVAIVVRVVPAAAADAVPAADAVRAAADSINPTPALNRAQVTKASCRVSAQANTTSVRNRNRTQVVRRAVVRAVRVVRVDRVDIRAADVVIATAVHVAPIAPGIRSTQVSVARVSPLRSSRVLAPTDSLCRRAASVRASQSVPMQMASDPMEPPGIPSVVRSAKPSVRRM
jgi:hypothetical protein